MSNWLIKLIDSSLLPAITLIFGKLIGIFMVSKIFDIDIAVSSAIDALMVFQPIVNIEDLQTLSSYSDLIMFAFVSSGLILSLVSSLYLQDSKISITTLTKLAHHNLMSMVKTSYEVYHKGIVWFVFTWIATAIISINAVSGKTYPWIAVFAVSFTIALSVILLRDFASEIELSRKKLIKNTF